VGSGAVDPDGLADLARPAGLRVFAAGMLRPGFDVLAGTTAGGGLRIDYANARDLAARIVAGEDVDVFASASPDHPRRLRDAGLVGEPHQFASNRLVVAVPAASPATDYQVLGVPGTRVVIEVAGIPLGDYTRDLLASVDRLADDGFSAAVFENVVFEAQTVFEVADRLLDGAADAAVLYSTDVAAHPTALRAIEFPPDTSVSVTCVACVVDASPRQADATDWVEGLVGQSTQAILREAGFGPPPNR
jgi:molybdate transport system substrate-binding protein